MSEKTKERMIMVPFEAGQVIFEEGARECWMYKIISGSVGIYKNYKTKHEMLLKQFEKGQCFGEMALLESRPRSAAAVCMETALLMRIPEAEFPAFISQYPQNALDIMKNLSESLRSTTEKLEESYGQLIEITLNKKEAEPRMLNMLERCSAYNPKTSQYEFIAKV